MRRSFPLTVSLVALALVSGCTAVPLAESWQGPQVAGHIAAPAINECSGLAVSRRDPDLLWTHNDSGGQPVLYAVDTAGRLRGSVRLAGVRNYDWEDVASFKLDGQAWLIVAETGDNYAQRTDCELYVIAEPDPAELSPDHEITVPVTRRISVRYPDGPRDCESIAVDIRERLVYLISKRTSPPVVYTLPLDSVAGTTPEATPIGALAGIPLPTGPEALINAPWGRYRPWPVGLDLAPDGTRAVVLTYGAAYLYARHAGETWAQAFARTPQQLPAHGLPQAEAVCFSRDARSIYISTEGNAPPLLRYIHRTQP